MYLRKQSGAGGSLSEEDTALGPAFHCKHWSSSSSSTSIHCPALVQSEKQQMTSQALGSLLSK